MQLVTKLSTAASPDSPFFQPPVSARAHPAASLATSADSFSHSLVDSEKDENMESSSSSCEARQRAREERRQQLLQEEREQQQHEKAAASREVIMVPLSPRFRMQFRFLLLSPRAR